MILGSKNNYKGGDYEEKNPEGGSRMNNQNEILLVDEVDVFFGKDFYGQTYNQVTYLSTPEIISIIKKIWNMRANRPTLSVISGSQEYRSLISQFSSWGFLIDNEIKLMCSQVNSFNKPAYEYNNQLDLVGYLEHDSVSYSKSYGYRTVFAYLHEFDKGNVRSEHTSKFEEKHLHMQISCGQFSYANINPACILGVNGTLSKLTNYENDIMSRYNINQYSIAPSVYGTKDLVFDSPDTGITIAVNKSDYFKGIVDCINNISRTNDVSRKKHRSIIVFFENYERMEEFRTSEFFRAVIENTSVNRLSENTPKDARDYIIKKAATVGQVTLSTKVFGRGTDFISRDSALNQAGGTHILQTFFSEMLSEEIQIQGRTSRQGQKGSYGMILLLEDDLIEGKNKIMIPKNDTLAHFGITESSMSSQSRVERYKYLCDMRDKKRETESIIIEENLTLATERDRLTRSYFSALLSGRSVCASLFEQLYLSIKGSSTQQMGFHVVFMLDESGSMGGSPFQELQRAYSDFIQQRLAKSESSGDLLTVINFDSTARPLATMVPFSSAPSLTFKGDNTNFRPALNLAESALQQAANRDLLPILILMTDGGCEDLSAAMQKLTEIEQNYSKDKLQVHFVAFGGGAEVNSLQQLKNLCSDGHLHTAAMGDLSATFKEIEDSLVVGEYYGM